MRCECVQTEPMEFKAAMKEITVGKRIKKLAEGSFKEVFECGSDVVQVMPIDGSVLINDDKMTAEAVIPEVTALNQLRRLQSPTPALNDPEGVIHCCWFNCVSFHLCKMM